MAEWTLKLNSGSPQTAEAWGLRKLKIRWANMQPDTLTMEGAGANVDAAAAFAFGDTITLYKDGTQYFIGKVAVVPKLGTGTAEGQAYEVRGPWWDLDRMVYQQPWAATNGVSSAIITANKGRVLLGRSWAGAGTLATQTLSEAVEDVVEWFNTHNPTIAQWGSFTAAQNFPVIEARDITCAEAIRRLLRWAPDAVVTFDYSTTPPTLNVGRRATASTTTQALTDLDGIEILSRDDLQVPAVVLKYESTHNVDDATYATVEEDKHPLSATGLELGAMVLTVELSGQQTSRQNQKVTTETIDTSSASWWQKKLPDLADVTGLAIAFNSASSWPRELVEGAVPAWLDDGTRAERIRLAAKVSYTATNADGSEVEVKDQIVAVNLVGTDLVTKTYSRTQKQTNAETAPTGLAQFIYDGLSTLQYEGQVSRTDTEVATGLRPGRLLRISGGLTAWATMDAQIQVVEEAIDDGITTLAFGPASQLSIQDLIELLRAHRGEPPTYNLDQRDEGQPSTQGEIDGAGAVPGNGTGSVPIYTKLVLDDGSGNSITIDPTNGITITDGSDTATLKPAEIKTTNGADVGTLTPTQASVSDGSGNNAGMTKTALGIEKATGEESTLSADNLIIDNAAGDTLTAAANQLQVDDGTSTGTITADQVEISVAASATATLYKDQLLIEGSGKYLALALADLPASGVADLRQLDYCDSGTAKTLYALATAPTV